MFSFLHYVGTNYSNATDCWTGCVWTRNCRYVLSSSQAKSQHRKLTCTTLALGTEKYKNNIIYYPERLYPERLYSNSIIYHLTLFIILQCHYTIMHQFHNGYIWQACIWFISCQAKDSETPKPMSAYCKTMAKNYVAGELCLWAGPGNEATPPLLVQDCALKAKFPIHSKIYSTML